MKTRLLFLFSIFYLAASGQQNATSSEILHEIQKLKNSTTVLYLAAHPDDENTRMISWLVNGFGARTAYMSLTRGDGGQNLIGTQLGAKLGVLRTQELMQARRIDGGEQFFSRAVDFGYSKTADETIEKWGDEVVLSDVVWVIRNFKPDVIITRFPPDKRGGHGHHTASAMLGIKAFNMAADEKAFPEQLQYTETWQPKRIYWNASVWWNRKLDSLAKVDDDYVSVEVGGYNPLQGTSYNELASLSRTQHKSQGFGVSVARGAQSEYLQYLDGEKAKTGLFEGISGKWSRFNFKKGDEKLAQIEKNFNLAHPEESVKALLELRKSAEAINDKSKRSYFINKVNDIILACLGVHAEALAESEYLNPGNEINIDVEAYCRQMTSEKVKLKSIQIGDVNVSGGNLENQKLNKQINYTIPSLSSQPYWLRASYQNLFQVNNQKLIGKAENSAVLSVQLILDVMGEEVKTSIPLIYKFSDRVEGEIIRPVIIVPRLVAAVSANNLIFTDNSSQKLTLTVERFDDGDDALFLEAEGWTVEPSLIDFLEDHGNKKDFEITITPNSNTTTSILRIKDGDGKGLMTLNEIDYSHIDKRLVFENVEPKLVKIDLNRRGDKIGYIPGAGDKVAEAISFMGYQVDILDEEKIKNTDLSQYQAVVAGIRAYNTEKWLPDVKDILMDYVNEGGNYIVQYNTRSRDLLSLDIGPYPFKISRERVTEEDAEVDFLLKENTVLNSPNKLTDKDFEGWVQERGLYFASSWEDKFAAPLGWHDKGEPSRNGGLIIADYGKGAFMYTGISFFREVPAGVEGAYRLLANILSYQNARANEQ